MLCLVSFQEKAADELKAEADKKAEEAQVSVLRGWCIALICSYGASLTMTLENEGRSRKEGGRRGSENQGRRRACC